MTLTLPDGYCIEVDEAVHAAKQVEIKAIADRFLVQETDIEGFPSWVLPVASRGDFSNAFRVLFGQEPRNG